MYSLALYIYIYIYIYSLYIFRVTWVTRSAITYIFVFGQQINIQPTGLSRVPQPKLKLVLLVAITHARLSFIACVYIGDVFISEVGLIMASSN
jgi:hypothetical protein